MLVLKPVYSLSVGEMTLTFHKKELKEGLKVLRDEKNETASSSVPVDMVAGKAPTAPMLAFSIVQPIPMVIATKVSVPSPGEPTIFEELAWHCSYPTLV